MKEEADIKQIYGIRLLRSNEHAKGTKMEFEFSHQKELGVYLNDKTKRGNGLHTFLTIEEKIKFRHLHT